jgi:hypothetical protein
MKKSNWRIDKYDKNINCIHGFQQDVGLLIGMLFTTAVSTVHVI